MRTTAGSLVWIRRALIVRGLAALLVVLAIAPFTAPFATLDAAELLTESSHATLDSSAKPAKQLATAAILPAPLFVAILQPLAREIAASGPIHLQRLRTIVLRV
jgi:hypothetical protein